MASGTTQDITAVDYVGPGDIVFATAGGQIWRNGAKQLDVPGVSFTDIAISPDGAGGLATAADGKLYSWNGTWTRLSLANSTFNHTCGGTGPFVAATPVGNLNAVTWASPTTAYVVGDDRGVVLKVASGTATDVSRRADGTCRLDPGSSDRATSVVAVTDQLIDVTTTNFGTRLITADGYASVAATRSASAVNCPGSRSRIGVDLTDASRSFVVGGCSGRFSFGFSSDSATTYDVALAYPAGGGDSLTGLNDVTVAGGSALAVGNGGAIVVSVDGRNAYLQPAGGGNATTDWLAVDKLTGTEAVVGGRGGALVVTTRATTTVLPPIASPVTAPVTPPARPGSPTGTTKTTIAGSPVVLKAPSSCVKLGKAVKLKVTGKGVTTVAFSLGSKRLGPADTRAPFSVSIATKELKRAKTYKVRAKVTVAPAKGKAATKTLKTSFTTC